MQWSIEHEDAVQMVVFSSRTARFNLKKRKRYGSAVSSTDSEHSENLYSKNCPQPLLPDLNDLEAVAVTGHSSGIDAFEYLLAGKRWPGKETQRPDGSLSGWLFGFKLREPSQRGWFPAKMVHRYPALGTKPRELVLFADDQRQNQPVGRSEIVESRQREQILENVLDSMWGSDPVDKQAVVEQCQSQSSAAVSSADLLPMKLDEDSHTAIDQRYPAQASSVRQAQLDSISSSTLSTSAVSIAVNSTPVPKPTRRPSSPTLRTPPRLPVTPPRRSSTSADSFTVSSPHARSPVKRLRQTSSEEVFRVRL